MEKPHGKIGKGFLAAAGLCLLALPLVVWAAFSQAPEPPPQAVLHTPDLDFDQNGRAVFENYDRLARDFMEGHASERTLDEYYSLRQYPGSPPIIPHKVVEADGAELKCLSCHADGGWTAEMKRNTPVTPHPEQESCRQCHVPQNDVKLFAGSDWMSVSPPRLGRSYLPGAPPPIPHDLQMRGNCIACHVGAGTVSTIRVEHPMRGNCRQCHVPDAIIPPFKSKYEF